MKEQPWQEFKVTPDVAAGVLSKIKKEKDIFSFVENPLLASLITCMGLQAELGNKQYDRLSVALGVDLEGYNVNPWKTEIISYRNKIGIRMWMEGKREIYPDHPDFINILDGMSLSKSGELNQIIIFPEDVADRYREKGLNLVIVKPWVLSSFLSKQQDRVNYFKTNSWEIELNSAKLQTQMMSVGQVAFSGTHDLVDHLLGGTGEGLKDRKSLYEHFHFEYQEIFNENRNVKKIELVTSYLIGVLLDDLAQPKWYGSDLHREIAIKALRFLASLKCYEKDQVTLGLPSSFHRLIELLRSQKTVAYEKVIEGFNNFIDDLLDSTETPFRLGIDNIDEAIRCEQTF